MPEGYMHALLGGMLIGLAAVILLWFNGRIMGVSGIASRLLAKPTPDSFWRFAFIGGLILGGGIYQFLNHKTMIIETPMIQLVIAGLCVGFGTVMGSGCTSGHGICGLARLSKRSIVATVVFMLSGIITVSVMHFVRG